MKEIFLAIIKETWHWSTILTCFADAFCEYGEIQRKKGNEFGRKFYYDLSVKLLEVRNEFNKREETRQKSK